MPRPAPLVDRTPPEARHSRRRLRACHHCDWVMALPPLNSGEQANCPRCGHAEVRRHRYPAQRSMALALASLITLLVAVLHPFLGFSVQGVSNHIELTQSATQLLGFHEPVVAIAVLLTIMVLPSLYLLSVIWLQAGLLWGRPLPLSRGIARSLAHLEPWMMADVFLVGTLVSLIKIAGLADIDLGAGFWAFGVFVVLLVATSQSLDRDWLWFALAGEPAAPDATRTGETAFPQGLTSCHTCGLINRLDSQGKGRCRRCGEHLHSRRPMSLQRTWALLAAAAILYIPANVYPIMTTTSFGRADPSTIIGGVFKLIETGSWPVAVVILVASVLVPLGKLVVLAWLCLVAPRAHQFNALTRTRLYRLTEFIGRWSMVDIFVVAVLVALIRAGQLMSITPGPAALAFGAVVVITMLAAMSFDPRLIWDTPVEQQHKQGSV
ncbi:paraquat-inducible protein A [Halomonas sp. 18H]|uniref:paraquat-inducible protein A n=1 Tax=Halomonas almeriensis TaxID=308163 RepID=UPI002231FA13|nr:MULTISPECIES: paraquat-inducible protein A [Halomonas]MCW4151771.1 paraquat-inducible protein A [Halomonas sp. 18H]MDN3554017.1 paraquat-inducible protein A [Halomonas almeriensis]